jgi:hypothetical protein
VVAELVHQFAKANSLTPLEEEIVCQIAGWQYAVNLVGVADLIRQLAAGAQPEPTLPDPIPVPLTEENYYAERSNSAQG